MKLKRYENEADIPEGLKEYYTKKGNAWVPDSDDSVLERSLDHSKAELRELKEKYKSIDLEQYQELLEAHETARTKKMIEAGQHDQLLQEAIDKTAKEYKEHLNKEKETTTSLRIKLRKNLITDRVMRSLISNHADPDTMDMASQYISEMWDLKDDDGDPVMRENAGHNSVDSDGNSHTIETFVKHYLSERPRLVVQGSGVPDATKDKNKARGTSNGVKIIHAKDRNAAFFENMKDIGQGKTIVESS